VFAVAVAAGGDADGLDAGVEAFGAGVGDAVGEVGQQPRLVTFEGLRGVDDRFQSAVGGPEVPACEVSGACAVPKRPIGGARKRTGGSASWLCS
jgi:hypothetical protein